MKKFILFITFLFLVPLSYTQEDTTSQVVQKSLELSPDLIHNIVAVGGPEKAKITWSLDYDSFSALKGKNIFIKYNTDIGAKRHKENLPNSDYSYSEPLDIHTKSYTVEDLIGNEKYVFYVGISNDSNPENAIFSSKGKFQTERTWGIIKLLILVGSLAFFIFGMKIMSEGLQEAAGKRLRLMLGAITSNRVKGVLTGFGITSIVQSSSVTTVMTVSFVNAGLMTLRQSAGVMMGANIGTTITAWLVLLLGFKVNIASYAFIILAFAGPLLFFQQGSTKAWANSLFGFCILFIGLSALKDAVPDLNNDSAIVQFFIEYKDVWYGNVMFVLLGALVTIVIQSSSAAMALTLALVHKGVIPFEVACAMVLGENIGTTITAELASLIANVHAKRSARIHSLFNVVGVSWMLLIFPLFLTFLGSIIGWSEDVTFDPLDIGMAETGIALFHTMFNAANVILLIWFVPQLVKLATISVRSRGDIDEEFKLEFINIPGISAEFSVVAAKKEVENFGKLCVKMSKGIHALLTAEDEKTRKKLFKKIRKYEDTTDRLEREISTYLVKASQKKMSNETTELIRGLQSIIHDMERIGDIVYQISKTIERRHEQKLEFPPNHTTRLLEMQELIEESLSIMMHNVSSENYDAVSKEKAVDIELTINSKRNELRKELLKSLEKGDYDPIHGMMYADIFSSFEKMGDHIINVSEAVVGEI